MANLKEKNQKISALTAYDYPFAKILDEAGIDIILVGDSLGNVILGYDNTLPVNMEEMLHHLKAVRKAVKRALLVVDVPLKGTRGNSFKNVKQFTSKGADAVKIEGTKHLNLIKKCVKSGIKVMGHIGFTPQDIKKMGGAKMQGKTAAQAAKLIKEAKLLEKAGVFAIVIELVVPEVAKQITNAVKIPTIGIGAGPHVNGQILVLHDMLGLTQGKTPSFVKQFTNLSKLTKKAVKQYIQTI